MRNKKGTGTRPAPKINQPNYSRATMFCLVYMITFIVILLIARHFDCRDLMIASFGNITASSIGLLLSVTFKEGKHDQNINAGVRSRGEA